MENDANVSLKNTAKNKTIIKYTAKNRNIIFKLDSLNIESKTLLSATGGGGILPTGGFTFSGLGLVSAVDIYYTVLFFLR
jgi:hypothetical protein